MKTLYESILDNEDEIMDEMGEEILIKNFLSQNYTIKGSYTIDNNIVNIDGDIIMNILNQNTTHLTNNIFKFGKVTGNFLCANTDIIDLTGAPEEVGKNFNCSDCFYLKSLKGGPEIVGRNFNCGNCEKLTNLEGAPKKLTGKFSSFTCRLCYNLKTLKGCPTIIPGSFDCENCINLTNLDNGPKQVGSICCDNCSKLTNISNKPKITKGGFSFLNTPAYKKYIETK